MSNYCIPLDIQEEIIKRLPVKSVIRFTTVSRQWKSLIINSKFISDYHICNVQSLHLLISYEKRHYEEEYVSVVDDDDPFPKQKFSINLPVLSRPVPCTQLSVIGSSQGLFCVSNRTDNYKNQQDLISQMIAVIWNPTIRKSVDIIVPNVLDLRSYFYVVGFGVLPHTSDPMLVKITCVDDIRTPDTTTEIPRQVEVFTLRSGAWRSLSSYPSKLPRKSIRFVNNQVVINGFIYWSAYDRYIVDDKLDFHDIIMSFDMTSEEFTEVHLPGRFSSIYTLSISKLRESLVVVENRHSYSVNIWTMNNGDPKTLAMIFTIDTPGKHISNVCGFRKNGEPFIEIGRWTDETPLFVYKPNSKRVIDFGISGKRYSFLVIPYMETLLLLDH